jgi:hypothetical protein
MISEEVMCMFHWIKGNAYTLIATLTDTAITLNNSAAGYFADIRWCLVGLDYDTKVLAIKPVTKNEYDLHLYPLEDLHKISVGTGYARISNKSVMTAIAKMLEMKLDSVKFLASWDDKEKMMTVDLNNVFRG